VSVLDVFFGAGNDVDLATIEGPGRERLEGWLERWSAGEGPAFLPRRDGDRLFWYGLAASAKQRREVQDLLVHWIGPLHSDVLQRRGALEPDDPFDASLQELLPERVVRVEVWPVPPGTTAKDVVRLRLERLVSLLDSRPARRTGGGIALPVLLDDLDIAATSGNAARAESILTELIDRRLLDAPNTTFVAVRVWSLLGQHERVLDAETLRHLDGLRIPGGTVLFVARSLYESRLRTADEGGAGDELLRLRSELPGVLRSVLRQGPVTTEREVVVARSVVGGDERAYERVVGGYLPDESHLQPLVGWRPSASPQGPVAAETPLLYDVAAPDADVRPGTPAEILGDLYDAKAYESVVEYALQGDAGWDQGELATVVQAAVELDDRRIASAVLALVERRLGDPTQVPWESRLMLAAVEILTDRARPVPQAPSSWSEWFAAASDGVDAFQDALVDAGDWPPLPPESLQRAIDSLPEPTQLAPVVGRLWTGHRGTLLPAARGDLARYLLTVIAFSDRRAESIRDAAWQLVVDALDAGLGDEEARELVQTTGEILVGQLSVSAIRWLIDIRAELGGELAASHPDALIQLDQRLMSRLRDIAGAVTRPEWEQLSALWNQVGLELPPDLAARLVEDDEPDPLAALAGLRILLYSLRERSARQAAARLQRAGAEVAISTDHDASPQLTGQVAGADLVVMVTAAAKHAATDAIEAAQPRELLRVNSAGMSAILFELERWSLAHR
jgi:hypothetical protein